MATSNNDILKLLLQLEYLQANGTNEIKSKYNGLHITIYEYISTKILLIVIKEESTDMIHEIKIPSEEYTLKSFNVVNLKDLVYDKLNPLKIKEEKQDIYFSLTDGTKVENNVCPHCNNKITYQNSCELSVYDDEGSSNEIDICIKYCSNCWSLFAKER